MSKNTETVINKLNVIADKFLEEFEEIENILTWNEHSLLSILNLVDLEELEV